MAVVNGNDVGIYVENQLIGCLTNATFSSTRQMIDVTCKDDGGARKVLLGGQTATISGEGMFDPASTYGLQELIAVHDNGTRVWVKIGDNTNLTITGYCYMPTLEFTGPLNAGTTFSFTFEFDGEYSYSTT